MSQPTRSSRCERTRAWAALAPDGELSQLERRLLEAHLAHCACCRVFADQVETIAEQLRSAALEGSARRFALPAAPVRRAAYARVRGVGAVAAVAAMAFGIATQAPVVSEDERPSAPRRSSPAEVDEAELQTLRQLRRQAFLSSLADPDRPSRTYGNQPA